MIKVNKRFFVAIQIGRKIQSIYCPELFSKKYNSKQIKWIPIENIHLTLSFIGDIKDTELINIIKLLEHNISVHSFKINIEGTGIFQLNQIAKILWLGISNGKEKLKNLNKQINQCISVYIKVNNNTFKPHITVARVKSTLTKIDVLPFLNTVYSPIEIYINSIYLYQSTLTPNGVKYSTIKKFPLKQGG